MAKKLSKIDKALNLTLGHNAPRTSENKKNNRYARSASKQHGRELSLLDAIDTYRAIQKAVPNLAKFLEGKIPADIAFSSIAPASLMKLVEIMGAGESEKNQLDAAKHLLSLAGHTPTQKHEIGRIDASTPKEALVSLIMGNKKNLDAAGIEIMEDDEPEIKD